MTFEYKYFGGPYTTYCLNCTTDRPRRKQERRQASHDAVKEKKEPTYNVARWLLSRGVISPASLSADAAKILFGERARRHNPITNDED